MVIDGFYEWDPNVKPKQPYFAHRKDNSAFAVAGIWASRKGKDRLEEVNFAMIIADPNGVMKPIYHRMPVILDKCDFRKWLYHDSDPDSLKALLVLCPDYLLEAYPVSTFVNKPERDTHDCLKPV